MCSSHSTGICGSFITRNNTWHITVDVDVPETIILNLAIPEGTTSTYDLTVQTPVGSSLPMFQLCSISIMNVGGNMPCVISGDKTPAYTSTVGLNIFFYLLLILALEIFHSLEV
jgi:hypothetical protein